MELIKALLRTLPWPDYSSLANKCFLIIDIGINSVTFNDQSPGPEPRLVY